MKNKGLVLATVAAALLASGTVSTAFANDADKGTVKCKAGNKCKNQSACKTSTSEKGKNDCGGKGMSMEKTAEDCVKAKGTVEK